MFSSNQRAAEGRDTGPEIWRTPRGTQLDPADLDVVDGAPVGDAPDGMHEQGLAEGGASPGPALQ